MPDIDLSTINDYFADLSLFQQVAWGAIALGVILLILGLVLL